MPDWLRWIVSAAMGVLVSFLLVVFVMSTLRDTSGFITVLKAIPTAFTDTTAECEAVLERGSDPVRVAGTVGTRRLGGFEPLVGVELVEDREDGPLLLGRSGPEGRFEVEAAFRWDRLTHCGAVESPWREKSKAILFRAPGCVVRNVPVTRNWIPHRVTLDCSG